MLSVRCVALAFFLPALAQATKPQRAVWEGYADLSAGKCRSTSLTEDGVLSPAPLSRKLADLSVEEAWAVLAQADGSFIVGTAPEGKLLRVAADGTTKTLVKFTESHIYALTAGHHGEIFAATSPNGKIYEVSPAGKTQIWFDPGETYIWSLAIAPDGSLYAGTGTKGRIYRVTARGKGGLWYASNETHIRSLGFDRDGALLAGSAPSGYLYKIPNQNQAVVLDDTGHEEINQLLSLPDGTVYFTATGSAKAIGAPGGLKKAQDASAPPADTNAASSLYCLSAAGDPREIWSTKDTILSAALSNGRLLLGSTANGALFSVLPHGESTRLARIDSDSITALASAGSNTIVASSNPARLFAVGSGTAQPGVYETSLVDSGSFAQWGAVSADASDGGAVKIFTRSGNTALPDKTWYDWVEAAGGQAKSAPARYLQLRLEITRGTVDRITAYFLARNQPPHIEEVRILPVGRGYQPAPASALPPLPQTAAQLLSGGSEPDVKTAMHYVSSDAHGMRTLIWKASDPNGDDLTYNISWRKKGESAWHDLARDLTESLLTWDTSSWSDGRYELKVQASDAAANSPGIGLTDEVISREMVVSNAPPVIQVEGIQNGSAAFTVRDELSGLRSVTGSTDGKSYHPLSPVDGILDSGSERFSVPVSAGQTLFIRAEDNSGNVAGAQVK